VPAHVRRAVKDDREAVVSLVVAAFVTELAVEYFFGDEYAVHAPSFFGYLFDYRLVTGRVWVAEDDRGVASVAMWNGPESIWPNDAQPQPDWESVASEYPTAVCQRLDAYEEFLSEHKPADAHLYLGVLATHPSRHGRGLARAVLGPTLSVADANDLPVYLETGTEANVGFYTRHGFVVDAEVDLPSGPRIWWMRRPAHRP
jgi:GNAT superfamily N-acetyltransferase